MATSVRRFSASLCGGERRECLRETRERESEERERKVENEIL